MASTFIYTIDDIITDDVCHTLINLIEQYSGEESKRIPDTNVRAKSFELKHLNPDTEKYVESILVPSVKKLINIFQNYGLTITGSSQPLFRKIYGPTSCHVDNVFNNIESEDNFTKKELRCLSVVIALNDNYDGGEFYFPLQKQKVKLKKRQCIIFPPYWTHPHYTGTLKNGTFRYTITFWLSGF